MKRILSLFSVLFLVTLVTFIMTDLAPSDSVEMYYLSKGITPSEEVLNETRVSIKILLFAMLTG